VDLTPANGFSGQAASGWTRAWRAWRAWWGQPWSMTAERGFVYIDRPCETSPLSALCASAPWREIRLKKKKHHGRRRDTACWRSRPTHPSKSSRPASRVSSAQIRNLRTRFGDLTDQQQASEQLPGETHVCRSHPIPPVSPARGDTRPLSPPPNPAHNTSHHIIVLHVRASRFRACPACPLASSSCSWCWCWCWCWCCELVCTD
jgi:hypothetical protein